MSRPNFRIVEQSSSTIPPKYPVFKQLYLEGGLRQYEIQEKLDLTASELRSFINRFREETGYQRWWRGGKAVFTPAQEKKKKPPRFHQKDYESIYEDFKEDYLHTSLKAGELQVKYDLNRYSYEKITELVRERTGWKRRNSNSLLINQETGEKRRIK